MTRPVIAAFALSAVLSFSFCAQGITDDAIRLATSLLTEGARKYDRKDAKAMADTYTDDGEVLLTTREDGEIKVKVYKGKDPIRGLYEELYKNAGEIQSENIVEFARLIGPDVLIIDGRFKPDRGSDAVPFVQVRTKRGDKWLILRLQIFVLHTD
jgi:hypothetical protein